MSFLYPRTIKVTRPGAQPAATVAVGDQGEAPSADPSLETIVASKLPASIQAMGSGGRNSTKLPGDAAVATWRILIPKWAAERGLIQKRDVITDDLGVRYQVTVPYWNSLGYGLRAEELEP